MAVTVYTMVNQRFDYGVHFGCNQHEVADSSSIAADKLQIYRICHAQVGRHFHACRLDLFFPGKAHLEQVSFLLAQKGALTSAVVVTSYG
jgi:hypothetical protein